MTLPALVVKDGGTPRARDHHDGPGLIGIRERVSSAGGEVAAGPVKHATEGRVTAASPLEQAR